MKKCIASFLICFVFAFGVITAFGCRDEVFAESCSYPIASATYISSGVTYDYTLSYNDDGSCVFLPCFFNYHDYAHQFVFIYGSHESYYSGRPVVSFSSSDNSGSYELILGRQFESNGFYISVFYSSDVIEDSKCDASYFGRLFNESYDADYIQKNIETFIPLMEGFSWVSSEPEFSEDIGYLSNVQVVKQDYSDDQVTGAPQSHITKRVYAFSWGYESSTGVDLSNPRYVLDIKARLEYKDLAFDDIVIDDSPLCNTFSYKSNWNTLHDSATNCLDAYSSDNIFNREGFGTIYYFRILDTETNTCGKWLKVDINWTGLTTISPIGETGDFDESGSWVGDGNETSLKGGMQNGDNESTLVFTDSSGKLDYSGIGDGVSSLVDGVGQVPSVISMLLSWLPNWVIVFLSVSIAIWGIMIVKKAIFG